jgi:exportin-2 (importin alpha re-exporter)
MTRRQAAADLLRALVSSGLEAETTEVAGAWINQGLQDYNNNRTKEDSWKSKDTAIYLLTAVATRGSTSQVSIKNYDSMLVFNTVYSKVSLQPTL